MAGSLKSLVFCLLFVVVLVSAQPQQRQRQQVSRLQQQQRQQVRRQQQQRKVGEAPRRPNTGGSEDIDLATVSRQEVLLFLNDEQGVREMTQCFINPKQCTSKKNFSLVKQVRALGPGGACKTCTKEEEAKMHRVIYEFVEYYITRYPQLWRTVLPHLGNLITFASRN